MLPIPYFFTRTSTWSGTYSQPNFLWYDFTAATASTNTDGKNTVATNGTFNRAWDFSGNGRHSDVNNLIRWTNNAYNGRSGIVGTTTSQYGEIAYTGNNTGNSTEFTMVVCIKHGYQVGNSGMAKAFAPYQTQFYFDLTPSELPINGTIFYQQSTCNGNNQNQVTAPVLTDPIVFFGGTQSYDSPNNVASQTLFTEFGSSSLTYSVNSNFGTTPTCFDQSVYQFYSFGLQNISQVLNSKVHFELMIWDRLLTKQQVDDVFGYLNNKYRPQ